MSLVAAVGRGGASSQMPITTEVAEVGVKAVAELSPISSGMGASLLFAKEGPFGGALGLTALVALVMAIPPPFDVVGHLPIVTVCRRR